MKKVIFFCLLVSTFVHSQVVISENTKGIQQDGSGVLELDSKLGFLPPVMTEEQRDLIPVDKDSEGLIIYSLTSKSINIYDGEQWHVVTPQFKSVGTSSICADENNYRELLGCIQEKYKVKNSLGYDKARDILYSEIDLDANNQLEGIYSGYKIDMDYIYSTDPSTEAFKKGMNAEHIFPQSMGAKEEPARSDMYHIYPAKANVNSSRNNCPHYEIIDANTTTWYIGDTSQTTIPTINIDGYSEKQNGAIFPTLSSKQQCAFEPREQVKGEVARAIFYFYTMYNKTNVNSYDSYADDAFFEVMREHIVNWDAKDPITTEELERASKIERYQGNQNPFLLDPQLGQRLFK